jgi:hypothetical protein
MRRTTPSILLACFCAIPLGAASQVLSLDGSLVTGVFEARDGDDSLLASETLPLAADTPILLPPGETLFDELFDDGLGHRAGAFAGIERFPDAFPSPTWGLGAPVDTGVFANAAIPGDVSAHLSLVGTLFGTAAFPEGVVSVFGPVTVEGEVDAGGCVSAFLQVGHLSGVCQAQAAAPYFNDTPGPFSVELYALGSDDCADTGSAFVQMSLGFDAVSGGSGSDTWIALAGPLVTAVPEPGAGAGLLFGALLLGRLERRRRSRGGGRAPARILFGASSVSLP